MKKNELVKKLIHWFEKDGNLVNGYMEIESPDSIFLDGYWDFEKLADFIIEIIEKKGKK